jgi:hypothetical protein
VAHVLHLLSRPIEYAGTTMSSTKRRDKKQGDASERLVERRDERSSPGSGEDEDEADLQPKDVENGDTAR